MTPERSSGLLPLKTLTGTVQGPKERKELNKYQDLFDSRTMSPWTSVFMTCMKCLCRMAVLAVNQASFSKCGELNWCGCLHKGMDDSRGGNANDLYGQ